MKKIENIMKNQALSAVTQLINFDQILLNETLSKELLDREKVSLLRKSLFDLTVKEQAIKRNKFNDSELTEILCGLLEEIEICHAIANGELVGKESENN